MYALESRLQRVLGPDDRLKPVLQLSTPALGTLSGEMPWFPLYDPNPQTFVARSASRARPSARTQQASQRCARR
jgi:hypothetical protein